MRRSRTVAQESDDNDVSTWPLSRLRQFLEEHNVDFPQPPIEKSELVRLVRDAQAALSSNATREEPSPVVPTLNFAEVDPAEVPAETLALHLSHTRYAAYLRSHPEYLIVLLNTVSRTFPIKDNTFPFVAKWLKDILSGDDGGTALTKALTTATNSICGKHLNRNDICFRCVQCAADPTCILCAECFQSSPCRNHEYRMIRSGGGMCDCGDPAAWKPSSFCQKHKGLTEEDDPSQSIPKEAAAWIFPTLRASMRVLLQLAVRLSTREEDDEKHVVVVKELAKRFSSLVSIGECSRRVVSLLLCERIPPIEGLIASDFTATLPGSADNEEDDDVKHHECPTILERIFQLEATVPTKRLTASWWIPIVDMVTQCISDHFFKPQVASLILKYRAAYLESRYATEKKSTMPRDVDTDETSLTSLSVQVFTVPTVVEALTDPSRLCPGAGSTISDALLSSALTGIVLFRDQNNKNYPTFERIRQDDNHPRLKLDPHIDQATSFRIQHVLIELKYVLKASKQVRTYFASSLVLNRALAEVSSIIGNSCWVRRDPNANERLTAWDIDYRLVPILQLLLPIWREAIRSADYPKVNDDIPQLWVEQLRGSRGITGSLECVRSKEVKRITSQLLATLSIEDEQPSHDDVRAGGPYLFDSAHGGEGLQRLVRILKCFTIAADRLVQDLFLHSSTERNILSDESQDPVIFTLSPLRCVAFVASIALSASVRSQCSASDLRTILHAALPRNNSAAVIDWIEALNLPFLAASQCAQDLWKRDFMGIGTHVGTYQEYGLSHNREHDVSLAQMLTTVVHPATVAACSLRQFSYIPVSDRITKDKIPLGYAPFMTHMLTLAFDDSKAGWSYHDPARTSKSRSVAYMVMHLRLLFLNSPNGLPRSVIQRKLRSIFNEDEEEEDEENDLDGLITDGLKVIAVSESRRDGTFYKLKPADQSLPGLNLYSCHLSFQDRRYMALAEIARLATRDKKDLSDVLPPLDALTLHPAISSSVRLLLHSDALLNVAAFVMICAAQHLLAEKAQDTPKVSQGELLLAIDALHACCLDAKRISSQTSPSTEIDWDAVEQFLVEVDASYDEQASTFPRPASVWPLPQLHSNSQLSGALRAKSLAGKMHITITEADLSLLKRRSRFMLPKPMTLLEAIALIHSKIDSASGGKESASIPLAAEWRKLAASRMAVVLAAFGVKSTRQEEVAATGDRAEKTEAEKSEKALRAKQRQKELLEKMKAKQTAAANSVLAAEKPQTAASPPPLDPATASQPTTQFNFHEACLVHATELECCFCQCNDDDDEPLCALAHFVTSRVLRSMGSLSFLSENEGSQQLPRPWVNPHSHFCGHVAHPRCVKRHFDYLAKMRGLDRRALLMAQRGYRGMAYIGASEFVCPICSKTCSAVAFLPRIISAESGPVKRATTGTFGRAEVNEDGAVSSFFCEMCEVASKESDMYSDAKSSLHNACIGFSPNTDEPALFDTDALISAMNRSNSSGQSLCRTSLVSLNLSSTALADLVRTEVISLWAGTERLSVAKFGSLLSVFAMVMGTETSARDRTLVETVGPNIADPLARYLLQLTAELHSGTLFSGEARTKILLKEFLQKQFISYLGVVAATEDAGDRSYDDVAVLAAEVNRMLSEDVVVTDMQSSKIKAAVSFLWQVTASAFVIHLLIFSPVTHGAGSQGGDSMHRDLFGASGEVFCPRTCISDTLQSIRHMLREMLPNTNSLIVLDPSGGMAKNSFALSAAVMQVLSRTSGEEIVSAIAESLLHLPPKFEQIVLSLEAAAECCKCGTKPQRSALCLTCGSLFCLQNRRTPELYEHSRTCCSGAAVFLLPKQSSFLVMQSVSGRAAELSSIYVDKYGERDELLYRGAILHRSPTLTQELVHQWMSWAWDVDSTVLTRMWRHGIERL